MGEASIPVDVRNPGQAFACLGFLETADLLVGGAQSVFQRREDGAWCFRLRVDADGNPFSRVLEFLAHAKIVRFAPQNVELDQRLTEGRGDIERSETFPGDDPNPRILPCHIEGRDGQRIPVTQWAEPKEATDRRPFKLFSGDKQATAIIRQLLGGSEAAGTRGLRHLWTDDRTSLEASPFDVLTPMETAFGVDARGGWTALDVGYSLDSQGHALNASPVVELLAAVGLENGRPVEIERRRLRYSIWEAFAPPILARASIGGASVGFASRQFEFELLLNGKNKIVTFAREENS